MKNIKFIIVLGMALCLASCDFNPKASSNQSFEWNFDLLWEVYMSSPGLGYDMDIEDTIRSVRERTKKSYKLQESKNKLFVHTVDIVPCDHDAYLTCFKYQGAEQLLVLCYQPIDCGGGCPDAEPYLYDLKTKTMTKTEIPVMSLDIMDFFDELTLLDVTEEDWADLKENDCAGVFHDAWSEKADLIASFSGFYGGIDDRQTQLAFDWNGSEFVRKYEADIIGATISEEGFCSLPYDSEIPWKVEGCDIKRQTFMAEGEEQEKYAISKDGELIMEIEPEWGIASGGFTLDFDPNNLVLKPNHRVDIITVYSDRYQTADGFHVGSPIQEVMEKFADDATTFYMADERLAVDLEGIQFILDKEDYDGTLPKIESEEGAIIDDPTFKPDACVKAIRLYNTK